jgi:hypothetical protein
MENVAANVIALANAFAIVEAVREDEIAICELAPYCEEVAADAYVWCGAIYFDDGTALLVENNEFKVWKVCAMSREQAREEIEFMKAILFTLPEN